MKLGDYSKASEAFYISLKLNPANDLGTSADIKLCYFWETVSDLKAR